MPKVAPDRLWLSPREHARESVGRVFRPKIYLAAGRSVGCTRVGNPLFYYRASVDRNCRATFQLGAALLTTLRVFMYVTRRVASANNFRDTQGRVSHLLAPCRLASLRAGRTIVLLVVVAAAAAAAVSPCIYVAATEEVLE